MTGSGYWYDDGTDLLPMLQALRDFRAADDRMRRRAGKDMGLNATDVRALRFVVAQEGLGEVVTAQALAAELDISTASTTKLLDRLARSGHLERGHHPHDRRAVAVRATAHAHEEIRRWLGPTHERMLEVARSVPPRSRADVTAFLAAMAAELGRPGEPPSALHRPR